MASDKGDRLKRRRGGFGRSKGGVNITCEGEDKVPVLRQTGLCLVWMDQGMIARKHGET